MVLAALLTVVGATAIVIATGLALHRKAASAADLAALAAATTSTTNEGLACEAAGHSAAANHADLVACGVVDASVVVVVRVESQSRWLPGFEVAARAGHG